MTKLLRAKDVVAGQASDMLCGQENVIAWINEFVYGKEKNVENARKHTEYEYQKFLINLVQRLEDNHARHLRTHHYR